MKHLTIIAALSLCACAAVPPAPVSPVAGIGETAILGGLTIHPLAVIEDSRCPASVQCVWAGRVRIRVMIAPQHLTAPTGPDAPSTAVARELDMTLGVPVVEFGRSVTLSSVFPASSVPGRIDPRAYRFTFALRHGGQAQAPAFSVEAS